MSGVISTRNGVPPEASDPPGGIPKTPDPDTRPHPVPDEGKPVPQPEADLPANEPPPVPPRREAQDHKAHSATIHRQTTVHVSRSQPQHLHK